MEIFLDSLKVNDGEGIVNLFAEYFSSFHKSNELNAIQTYDHITVNEIKVKKKCLLLRLTREHGQIESRH